MLGYSNIILRDSAELVWPLDDLNTGSVSLPITYYGKDLEKYAATVNFNNTSLENVPMIFGGNTNLKLNSPSVGMSIPALGRFSDQFKNRYSSLSFWIRFNDLSTTEQPIVLKRGQQNTGIFIKDNYLIFKYGNSSSYSQISAPIFRTKEPHLVYVCVGPGSKTMVVDGISYPIKINSPDSFPEYDSDENNDFLDFYGPSFGSWEIDSPAFWPNQLEEDTLKSHYVYGLGKWAADDLFYAQGGVIYNFSTVDTDRILDINWRYPEDWKVLETQDLMLDELGIVNKKYSSPRILSIDNNIDVSQNSVTFRSSSPTAVSYIQFNEILDKIDDGKHPFVFKFTLDGPPPGEDIYQRLVSYGRFPDQEFMKISLYNDSASGYQVVVQDEEENNSILFDISNISSSPTIFVGFRFYGESEFFFAENGQNFQIKSFDYIGNDGSGQDPLSDFFPPDSRSLVRVGSSFIYDIDSEELIQPLDRSQFSGTFHSAKILPEDYVFTNFQDLESYRENRSEYIYDSSLQRFKVGAYGKLAFYVHASEMAEYIDDQTYICGSNVIEFGYPDIHSSSQVFLNVGQYFYSGSVVTPEVTLGELNYLGFLNNNNIAETYLKFNLKIYGEDVLFYPPIINFFRMETHKSEDGLTRIIDSTGLSYLIYPNTSSVVHLPENFTTPNILLSDNSGIKVNNNIVDFTENINPIPLDPRSIDGLVLWLDARFPLGLKKTNYEDDERVVLWKDLSGNNYDAVSTTELESPVYRLQSLNLLRINQLTGSEVDDLSFIYSNDSILESSINAAVTGERGVFVRPEGFSTNSYMEISSNTASITVFPNQQYTVVGTIKLDKRQTASALHEFARSVAVYEVNSSSLVFLTQSSVAENSTGIYSVSAVFSTSSSSTGAVLRFYNGSYKQDDLISWDDLGLYPIGDLSGPITSWQPPLTSNDSPTVKFDGINTYLSTSASVTQPYTMYVVGRAFNDGVFVGYSASGASIFSYDGSLYVDSGVSASQTYANNEFNIYAITFNSGSAKLFLNGLPFYKVESGRDNIIDNLLLGKGSTLGVDTLSGDISAVLLYKGDHNYLIRSNIETWLDESFNLIHTVLPVTPLDDVYLDEYTERYPLLPAL